MFCSNCGKEVSGNFCSNCGAPVNTDINEDTTKTENSGYIIELNGKIIDLNELVSLYGKDKIASIKHIVKLTGAGLAAAKKAYEEGIKKLNPEPDKKMGFWEKAKLEAQQQREFEARKKAELNAKIAQMDKDGIAYCPKCYSTSLSTNKKGFGFGKSVVGAAVVPVAAVPVGLLAGGVDANKLEITCLKCGYKWKPGKK